MYQEFVVWFMSKSTTMKLFMVWLAAAGTCVPVAMIEGKANELGLTLTVVDIFTLRRLPLAKWFGKLGIRVKALSSEASSLRGVNSNLVNENISLVNEKIEMASRVTVLEAKFNDLLKTKLAEGVAEITQQPAQSTPPVQQETEPPQLVVDPKPAQPVQAMDKMNAA